MPIARIIMTEQNAPEAQEQLLNDHREEVRNGFLASADFSVAIKLGDTSYMILTVYETYEIADANKDARVKWIKEREAWAARHSVNDGNQFVSGSLEPNMSNVAGVVALMKWGVVNP